MVVLFKSFFFFQVFDGLLNHEKMMCTYLNEYEKEYELSLWDHNKRFVERNWDLRHVHIFDKHREILNSWLMEIIIGGDFIPQSFYMAVQLCDLYLCKTKDIRLTDYQLVGVCAFDMACKYHELSYFGIKTLIKITGNSCTKKQIHNTSWKMFEALDWNISWVITPFTFLKYWIKRKNRKKKKDPEYESELETVYHMACYLSNIAGISHLSKMKSPGTIAACCLYMALYIKSEIVLWNSKWKKITRFDPSENDLLLYLFWKYVVEKGLRKQSCIEPIYESVMLKYTSKEFNSVSLSKIPRINPFSPNKINIS